MSNLKTVKLLKTKEIVIEKYEVKTTKSVEPFNRRRFAIPTNNASSRIGADLNFYNLKIPLKSQIVVGLPSDIYEPKKIFRKPFMSTNKFALENNFN